MLLDGKTTTLLRKKLVRLFSPRKPRFRRRVRGFLTEEQTPSLRRTLARAFSPPLAPSFGRTEDNALLLTAFALAFSPVNPLSENDGKTTGNRLRLTRFLPVNLSFVAAFAALRVSFPGACPGKDGFF